MKISRSARLVSLDRAAAFAWLTWAGYTLGCAWPMWSAPVWSYPLACLGYGILARVTGSDVCAGASGACISAPLLRVACDDHGMFMGFAGMLAASLICLTIVYCDPPCDGEGRIPAGQVCTLLWLATTATGPLGLLIADALARVAKMVLV